MPPALRRPDSETSAAARGAGLWASLMALADHLSAAGISERSAKQRIGFLLEDACALPAKTKEAFCTAYGRKRAVWLAAGGSPAALLDRRPSANRLRTRRAPSADASRGDASNPGKP